jgi:hypothetical protein
MVYLLYANRLRKLGEQKRKQEAWEGKLRQADKKLKTEWVRLDELKREFKEEQAVFDARAVKYEELKDENEMLKGDLQNVDVERRKLLLDRANQERRQEELDARAHEFGKVFLKDNISWIGSKLTSNNYTNSKSKIQKVIESCRKMGFEITEEEEAGYLADLKAEYEKAVRAQLEKEEQARIKAQIREEQRLEREIEKELKQLDREREAIQTALEKALAENEDEHAAEIESLRERLKEAEERSQRAISRAQMTKSGHVYVISNIGSFGEDVFKIGMTRRLEPHDRVRELSSASVPFPYDVHMMISADDAPTLENTLHKALHKHRVNKANPRKEFFRAELEQIAKIVQENHGVVDYVADAEALEYRETLEMTDEDFEFIDSLYADDDDDEVVEDDV